MIVMVSPVAFGKESPPEKRIPIESARETAVKKYSGKIQSEELEFENGKWIYSFDLKKTNDKKVYEIQVDALTGKIVDEHTESAAVEKKEQQDEKNESKLNKKLPLQSSDLITLPGNPEHFDFMETDTENQRILAAHAGAKQLEILDLKDEKSVRSVPVGNVQGVAVDSINRIYILGDAQEHKVVFLNSKTLEKLGETEVSGPVDAVAVDSKNGKVFAGEDDGQNIWVIDVKTQKTIATIAIPGVPECLAYNSKTDRIYLNIKTKDLVVVINPNTNKLESQWSTLPATAPHGLALDEKTQKVFVAGRNGKLVSLDAKTGTRVAEANIAEGTDQIAFDSTNKTIYSASKGFLSVVKETEGGLEFIGNVESPKGAHTLAIDSLKNNVWVSYANDKHSYLQKFSITNQ